MLYNRDENCLLVYIAICLALTFNAETESGIFNDFLPRYVHYQRNDLNQFISCFVSVPPLIDFVSHNATANETDDVVLFCNATGNPTPNITWTFLNGPETSVIRIGENHTLSNVTRNQAGTYQCIAINNVKHTKTANVNVIINCKYSMYEVSNIMLVIMLHIGRFFN